MRRLTLRVLFAVIGVSLLAVYLGAAYAAFVLLSLAWHARPDLATTVAVVVVLTVAFGYSSYRYGTQRLLASMNAQPLPERLVPGLYRRLERLCERMDIDEPALFVADMGVPNAVALGGARIDMTRFDRRGRPGMTRFDRRGRPGMTRFNRRVSTGVVVFDVTLFRILTGDELEAVLAHELAHLESRDSLVQTLAYSFVQSIVGVFVLALLPVTLFLTGLARAVAFLRGRPTRWTEGVFGALRVRVAVAVTLLLVLLTLVVRAHSRGREFHADDRAVEVTGDPRALALALRKIERASEAPRGIRSPLYVRGDEDGVLSRWLSTHPSMDDRVERLKAIYERDQRTRDTPK